MKNKKTRSKRSKKIGLGVGGLAALGLALAGSANAQSTKARGPAMKPSAPYKAPSRVIRPAIEVVDVDEFLQNYRVEMTAEEKTVWETDDGVAKAWNVIASMKIEDKISFVQNPKGFVASHPFFSTLGIGIEDTVKTGAIAANVRAAILRELQAAGYMPVE